MTNSVYLGIDLGTSAVKVLAMSAEGKVLSKGSAEYPTHSPQPGWSEQSPEDWWRATCEATRHVMAELKGAQISGVSFSGQLNGFVLTDEEDVPVHDALIWLDIRATEVSADMATSDGSRILEISRNQVSPIAVLPKLKWFRDNYGDLFKSGKRLFLVKDYILWKLTGRHTTDPSDAAATAMMDFSTQEWSKPLCELAGIDPARMPEICPSDRVVGMVRPEAAEASGVPEGTPVVAGAGDVTALSVGCGVINSGVLAITLGTAGHVVLSEDGPPKGAPGEVWVLSHAIKDKTIWLGLVMSGGLCLSWLNNILSGLGYEEMAALSERSPPGAQGITFLPFLEGASTPYHQPEARGSFTGLSSSHSTADMIRSVLEGVAFNIRECVELFEKHGGKIDEVRIGEGGSRTREWCQIISDVVGRPVRLLEELDASALGAAMIAQAGIEERPLAEVVSQTVQLSDSFVPNADLQPVYDEAYDRYKTAVRRLMPTEPQQ